MSVKSTVAFPKQVKIVSEFIDNTFFLKGSYIILSDNSCTNSVTYNLNPNPINLNDNTDKNNFNSYNFSSKSLVLKDTNYMLNTKTNNQFIILNIKAKLSSNINLICWDDIIHIPLKTDQNCNIVDRVTKNQKDLLSDDTQDISNCYHIYYYYILNGQGVISITYTINNNNIDILSLRVNMVRDSLIKTNLIQKRNPSS